MSEKQIDYGKLIDDAMHIIVKKALEFVKTNGLPGNHHFFISFATTFPGVKISKALLKKYPEEMTIVLQHQFEELIVKDTCFSVKLSFENVKEKIEVPFDSLIAFADPGVRFGLQFKHSEGLDEEEVPDIGLISSSEKETKATNKAKKKNSRKTNVVDLESFRNNLKKD